MIVSRYLHESFDVLSVGVCEYDAEHRAVGWNRTFLHFFPEDDGLIYPGEPYVENLRRFYTLRLAPEEMHDIDRYIAEGMARHENQTQAFEFLHNGRRLRANSLLSPCGGRVRMWQMLEAPRRAGAVAEAMLPAFEALRFIPDGAMLLDGEDRIIATNDAFRDLYDISADTLLVGLKFDEIVAECWRGVSTVAGLRASILNGLRYDGAPFEIELPGQRWRRVVARHTLEGLSCFIHADTTAAKRQQAALLSAQDALRQANAELVKLAQTDGLTGLANRRRFIECLASEAARPQSLALLIVDVDHFKAINDQFGHVAGDTCLRLVAQVIDGPPTGSARLVARLGGEEFGVLIADATPGEAMAIAEGIRLALAQAPWRAVDAQLQAATVSIGLCWGHGPLDGDALYAHADAALYAAKRNGRDRIETVNLPTAAGLKAG